jgi:isopentenyldiphosphate isomerase
MSMEHEINFVAGTKIYASTLQPNRAEVHDMIWEVDEDCDGMVSWLEFQNMYTR